MPRFHEIDGLRGWASLSVVSYHFFWEFFGTRFPEFRTAPFAMLTNGTLAVCIFFVLSGEALATAAFRGANQTAALAIKRYARLAIPVFASTLVVFLLAAAGLTFFSAAAPIIQRQDWLADPLAGPIGFADVLRFSFAAVFDPQPSIRTLNPFLWTMKYELSGSVLVIVCFALRNQVKHPLALGAILFVFLQVAITTAYVGLFLIGTLFAYLRRTGFFQAAQAQAGARYASLAAIAVLAVVNVLVIRHIGMTNGRFLRVETILTIPLMFSFFYSRDVTWLLRTRLSLVLGKVSFPLFLLQFPVLVSYTSWLTIYLAQHNALQPGTAALIAVSSLALSLMAATIFLPVERFTTEVGRVMTRTFVNARTTPDATAQTIVEPVVVPRPLPEIGVPARA